MHQIPPGDNDSLTVQAPNGEEILHDDGETVLPTFTIDQGLWVWLIKESGFNTDLPAKKYDWKAI